MKKLTSVNRAKFGGVFDVVCRDSQGKVKWKEKAHNLVTNEGLNHILDAVFHGSTQVSPWYVGLKGAGAPAASDDLASHSTWTENAAYTGDRKEYDEAAASGQSITNSASKATFAITSDSQAIAGAFLASVSTGTSGTLLCAANFSTTKNCDNGDTLDVTYTFSAADDGS